MKNYEKPMIINVGNSAEGVYLASGAAGGGDGECFRAWVEEHQHDTDVKKFHVYIEHNAADHHSNQQRIVVSFTNVLSEIVRVGEGQVTNYYQSGNDVVLETTRHANYGPESTSFNLEVKFSDVAWGVAPGPATAVCYDTGKQTNHNNC